jgi:LysR family transcriptional regulator, carnitine catabolism transcriptional activator
VDLRRLEHFLSVVDHGGFTAASAEVGVSQPGLSFAVKELERELGVQLFERVGRRVQLSAAGLALVEPARQALRDVETGRAAVAAVAGVTAGTLALASLPTLVADPLANLVGRYRQLHPGVVVDLSAPEDTNDLLSMVREGRSEAGLTEAANLPADLVSRDIGTQELLLVLPPDPVVEPDLVPATALDAPTVALADMVEVPFVAAPTGTSTRRLLDEGFAGAGAEPLVAVVTAQRDAILPLVVAGAGAALVPEPIASLAATLGARVRRPLPSVTRGISLVHRPGPLSPAAARFVALAGGAEGR